MSVINLTQERESRYGQQLEVDFDALHRYNDYTAQVYSHENGRILSTFEVDAIINSPEQLGLGHGPFASRLLNPAV